MFVNTVQTLRFSTKNWGSRFWVTVAPGNGRRHNVVLPIFQTTLSPEEPYEGSIRFGSGLVAFLSLPATSEAFSRRSQNSEVAPTQAAAPIQKDNVSAQAVPEPPVLLLMSIGLGMFVLYSAIKAIRKEL